MRRIMLLYGSLEQSRVSLQVLQPDTTELPSKIHPHPQRPP